MKRILIVDDSPESAVLAAKHFQKHAYEVKIAFSGLEAIELLQTETFDIILSDVLMPSGSGVDLLREMQAEHNDTPVILMSADNLGAKAQAKALCADAFICKPFDTNELLNLAERLISERAPNSSTQKRKKPKTEVVGDKTEERGYHL